MVVTDKDVALFTPSSLITKYPSDKIFLSRLERENIKYRCSIKWSKHGELFVNSGKAYCAPMDGFCVPFSVKKESEFPAISAYGSYGGSYLFFDSENHRFLASSILGFSDYMVPNSATQDIRNYGTKWTDQNT